MSLASRAALTAALLSGVLFACAQGGDVLLGTIDAPQTADGGASDPSFCTVTCSADKRSVVDTCKSETTLECAPDEECQEARCVHACTRAEEGKASIGCDYWAVDMDITSEGIGSCFVAFVTNTFSAPAHISAAFTDEPIDLGKYAKIPKGKGRAIEYTPYDPAAGLAPGEVAILFLANFGGVACPVPAARAAGAWVNGTGYGNAFHITSDVPVVAFQMLPYGGGSAAMTGASLLLPTSAWGTNYVAVNAFPSLGALGDPSLDVVAMEDDTTVQIVPKAPIVGRPGLVAGAAAGEVATYTLKKGEVLQLTQPDELTGSAISSNKRVGLFGGHMCMNVPRDVPYCDHAEQQIAPVQALGSEYVAVPHRARRSGKAERHLFRLVGAVDGTALVFDPPIPGAPAAVGGGEHVDFESDGAFVVRSQDAEHPFMLFAYMTGGSAEGYGDPDFVRVVPPSQYLERYVFFTDPTYPETSLTVVRRRTPTGFADVELECHGKIESWTPLGPDTEIAHVDLVRHDFEPQGKCDNGVQTMSSTAPFGVTVWAWGTPETSDGVCGPNTSPTEFTCHVSYAYPAGESVKPVNSVVVGPVVK